MLKCFICTSFEEARIAIPISSGRGVAMKKDPRKYVKYFLYFFEILLDANIAALCFDNSLISSIKDILIK